MGERRRLIRRLALLVAVNILLITLAQTAQAATWRLGSTGSQVRTIQTKLKNWGYYSGEVDGIYGTQTQRAVEYFQRKNGLSADGVAGPATLKALGMQSGSGAAAAMTNAVKDAGAALTDITYINAHGTATHHNDLFETRAIKLAFGSHAKDIKINSTKSMVGHLLGAAGAIEFITCVKELECGFIHKTVGLMESEEELDLNYCKESYQEDITYALSNSLGFGGHNASILLKKFA